MEAKLAEIRAKREAFLALRAEAAELAYEWVPKAVDAGMPLTEIAARSGLSRQGVYNVLKQKQS